MIVGSFILGWESGESGEGCFENGVHATFNTKHIQKENYNLLWPLG
jgi:hypothetical protein